MNRVVYLIGILLVCDISIPLRNYDMTILFVSLYGVLLVVVNIDVISVFIFVR